MSDTSTRKKVLEYFYAGKTISYSIWHTGLSGRVDTVVFLGTVQIGKLPEWAAEYCPPGTVIVQGAPHWHAKDDGSDMPAYMFDFTRSVFQAVIDTFQIHTVDIIADSQAAPAVLQLFCQKPFAHHLHKLALLQPLGFNQSSFVGSDLDSITEFKRRILKNAYRQVPALLTDKRLRHNHRLLSKKVRFNDEKARAQYGSGLAHDATPHLEKLLRISPDVRIVCGENDAIFPAGELRTTLQDRGIDVGVTVVKGVPHSPLGTIYGRRLLNAAFDYFARSEDTHVSRH